MRDSAKLTVAIGENIGPGNLERLRTAFPSVDFRPAWGKGELLLATPEAEVIFSKSLPAEVVRAAKRLRWVQAGVAGVERMLANGLGASDVVLTNARGAHGVPMSELILSMMLAFATGLHSLVRAQPERRQVRAEVVARKFELEGQTLCVLGLGDIGGTLARKASRLGMRVVGVRRSQAAFPGVDEVVRPDRLLDVLPAVDHVALCLPLTAETRGIVGEPELRAMKPTAYIYNVGRGDSIAPAALLRALREGWIAGAGLDVTSPEPLPDESPLWEMPNVLLSQHSSGSSPFNADRITAIFAENLARYLDGRPLGNVVDKDLGY